MINPFQTCFGAIFLNEVLINSKRVAPYVLMVLFSANAIFWWHAGPAIELGWATNSDFYIARVLKAFSFLLGLPIFNAVIMGDAVIRDFRLGLVPLVFSKPITRAQYLLGKFFGSFFVLVCCQAAFPLTLIVLQAFRPARMVVQPAHFLIYFKHFFFFVVITHLVLAAVYFSVGALSRNSKVVYGVAVCFYPVYISAMLLLFRGLSLRGRTLLDMFLLNTGPSGNGFGNDAEFLNQYVYSYNAGMIANRALMVLISVACLLIAYWRFSSTDRAEKFRASVLDLSTAGRGTYFDSPSVAARESDLPIKGTQSSPIPSAIPPGVTRANQRSSYTLNPFHTRFGAIFLNEVLINSKRVALYALMVLFSANAILWWGWGPAVARGWATNSDFYISRNMGGFSIILGLPIFTAVIMGDPVIRDFKLGIVPLVLSKPISRATYLLGKFFGNFFVLVCCQSAFAFTFLFLQAVPFKGMVVQPWRVAPYFKHFLFTVVISHLILAAIYFTVGTLTRNAKIVYGLAALFYPLYIAGALLMRPLSIWWHVFLDPMGFAAQNGIEPIEPWHQSAEFLNRFAVTYNSLFIANRAAMIVFSAVCLFVLYLRFSITERPGKPKEFSWLSLSTASEGVYASDATDLLQTDSTFVRPSLAAASEPLPRVTTANEKFSDNLKKLIAAVGVELRLLRAERSLIVLLPLALVLSIFDVAFFRVTPEISYSATYATGTANAMLLFLIGISVFYTGEAMHRDRELRIEPVLWSMPASNGVLLMSKFFATLGLALSLVVLIGVTAIATQFLRGHRPVELRPYLLTYSLIVFPGLFFLAAMALVLNVVLREKYATYAVSVGIGAAMFYLYSMGYLHWLYNPLAYHLWKYADLVGGNRNVLLWQRSYWLAVAIFLLALSHACFARKMSSTVSRAGR
ncbi:MAG TPA: ABC transporter permease subunit [Pyrinomonadaceae bacterium]